MRIYTRLTLAFLLVLMTSSFASAQTPFGPPDDRYDQRVEGQSRYPRSLVPGPTKPLTEKEALQCGKLKPYDPADTHLMQYTNRVKIASVRIQATDECTWMRTAAGDQLVRRVAGTKVAQDELGRDLFDFGSPNGKICGNPRPFSVPVNVPPPTPPEVVKVTEPAFVPPAPPPPPAPVAELPPPPPAIELPPPAPPARRHTASGGPTIVVGVAYSIGNYNAAYEDAIPNSGDVPQQHGFTNVVPVIRIDQNAHNGVFGSISASALGKTSGIQYQDLTGAYNGKNRDSDSSRDSGLEAKVGYKHSVGENISAGGFGGYTQQNFDEDYVAQGATSVRKRSYSGFIVGGELTGATRSIDHQVNVNVSGHAGLGQKRDSTYQQTYPGINFPRVDDPQENASRFGFRAEAEVQVMGPLNLTVAYDYKTFGSTRPSVFTAHERINVNAITVGVVVKLGR